MNGVVIYYLVVRKWDVVVFLTNSKVLLYVVNLLYVKCKTGFENEMFNAV